MQFFAGISLWDNKVVNENQELEHDRLQNSQFSPSYSLQEARNNNSLNLEGSLRLDLKLFSATGSAKYLNDNKSTTYEARTDVACTIVVEGGSAALTFSRPCSSSEEVKKITGKMKVTIVKIPISGSAKIDFSEEEKRFFGSVRISYSDATAESVVNLEDALRVARDMPIKLAKRLNTLSYKLLSLSVLDGNANRLIIVSTLACLKDLEKQEAFKNQFPKIQVQILGFSRAFSIAETEFAKAACRLLPELREHGSVTQRVTCFRIRPLAPIFDGKTLLIVDTPGFGDSRGIERDAFLTAAISEFFKPVNHVNAVIFAVRANEAPYTFSDAGAPLARGALQALRWPVENGEISVNNSSLNLELDGSQNDIIVRESWIYSVRGQFSVMHMLLRATPVSTQDSSDVTRNRMKLERRCELAEKNIIKLAELSEELTKIALLHDPSSLLKYLETLYKTAKVQGALADHLAQLATVINTLVLVREFKGKGRKTTRDSNILLDVIGTVQEEMERRMRLSAHERAAEEEKPCNLYNGLWEKLPAEMKKKAPAALRSESFFSQVDRYPANPKAIIGLIRLVLKDEGVIAALVSEGEEQ
ncbi:hypothetical protein M426DRAFT_16044 [Hypoxylon sp. CI-4A]|nr:hypothetical protein M426DRAFT_16044 [Hypoxylon sp. CI-4A]